ncbi:MBG domain-containing protein, partial [Flavobacterium yafengii]|uniref:Ig-like domain-containing protein n=1 Tax=Flavobacterium yafengii TaxID=3041253 RepID=UPI0024A9DE59
MNEITLKTNKIIFFILFILASLNLYSQTPIFSNPSLKSGTANSVGAKYLYTGVTTVDGTSVDAVVTIVSVTNVVLVDIDNPNNGGGSLLNRFQPVIRSTVSGGNVEFDFTFYKSGTYGTALELKIDLSSFTIETLDIDGGEFFDIVIPTNANYTLESPTKITVSTVSPYTRFTGPNESVDPISITNTAYIASVSYGRVNSVKFRLGSTNESNDRQSSISFGEVTYDIPKAPVANDDSKLNQTNGPVSIDVTLNDTDANQNINKSTIDLNTSTSSIQTKLTVANEGEWKVDSNGIVTFTPLITFIGNPTPITYVLKDLTNLTSNIATITITYKITPPLDTDTDGIINNIDLDDDNDGITDGNEGCNFTSVLANPTDAIVNSLNTSGTGLFPLDPFGPAVLPQNGVNVSVISGFSTSSQQWRIYQPTVINASISIQGNPTNFATKYLDLIGAYTNPKVIERTVKLDYQVTSKSLNSGNYKYRYIIGIAGLSDPNAAGKITSSVPLEVIGNVDVFNTGKYSYFDGSTPPVEGQVGTIMASNPLIANSVAPPNGYTFYYLPDDITSFNLRTEGNDQYGFIFGALTLLCDDTDGDSMPNALDYDSDNDDCSDANEAYSSINADTNGDGTYSGVVGITQVNNNGLVIAAGINSTGKNYNTTPSPNVKIATKITSSTNPVDTFTTVGQSATFSVTATAVSTTTFSSGTPNYTIPPAIDSSSSLTYQWQVNTGLNWVNISNGGTNPLYANTTTATLSISQVTTNMKGYQYRVLIKHLNNVCASVTSNSASLSCVNPLAPTANDQTVCSDGTTTQTLTATATGGTITWYDAATAGNLIASPTQVGVGTKTYYAQASNNNCSSSTRTPVKLTINVVPAAPTASNQTVCTNGTTTQTLTATATGGTITWYDAATAGNVVSSPTQVGVGTKTYYAQANNGTCSSLTRTAVKLTINIAPAAPTATNQTVCSDETTTQTLTATATGGTITWYDAATAGNVVSSPTQVGVGTKTYYAQANNGTCSSLTRTAVKLTINVAPAAPTASNQTVCTDGTTTQTLTATATGGTITWYDAATAGNVVSSPTQVGIGTKTYYAQSSNGTCSSITRTAVKLTINPLPGTPNANNVEYCQGDIPQALTATVSNPANNLYYFSSLNSTPQTVLTPSTSTAGQFTYYVAEESNSCLGPKKAITVLINPKAVITSQPADKNIIYGNNISFSVVATNVTTYQWQVNNGTGYTNITNNSIYSNATTPTLTIANPTVAMSNYKYRVLLTGTCINTTTDPATLTVTPKVLNVTVVADDQTKVYGDLNPALTAVVSGAVNGDTINYTLATTATQFSNVGAYPIAVTLGANPNYTVVATDATLTVSPKVLNVTVVADDQTKVYGDLNPALTAVVSGAVNGDTINYTLATTATQFSNVGAYPIAVTLGANPNYTVVATDATLTVSPKVLNVTVVADDQTKVYGDLNPALTAIVSGAVNGDTINYT